jgi:Fe2+ transport system protein B
MKHRFLVGEGARAWAVQHQVAICETEQHITSRSKRYRITMHKLMIVFFFFLIFFFLSSFALPLSHWISTGNGMTTHNASSDINKKPTPN